MRRSNVLTNGASKSPDVCDDSDPAEVAALLEQADADAVAAEAAATAARARAEAIRLRHQLSQTTIPAGAAEVGMVVPVAEATAESVGDDGQGTDPAETPTSEALKPGRWARLLRPGWPAVGHVSMVLTIVGAAALSATLWWMNHEAGIKAQQSQEFQTAARDGVLALTSLDFADAQSDVDQIMSHATGDFQDDFQRRAEDFRKVIETSEVVSQGKIFATAVESMTNDSAVVLVAATSEITSPPDSKEAPRGWRLAVTVTREIDGIKLSNVEFVK